MLQTGHPPKDGKAIPYVSDFFDFSVYIDAEEEVLRRWYVNRFLTLRRDRLPRPEVLTSIATPASTTGRPPTPPCRSGIASIS